jgi:hypothetical protein
MNEETEVRLKKIGESTQVVDVRIAAKLGTPFGACVRDAIALAATEWRNVTFDFAGVRYKVLVNDLFDAVQKSSKESVQ